MQDAQVDNLNLFQSSDLTTGTALQDRLRISYRHPPCRIHPMATPSLIAAETLPKFLLPKLSWKAAAPLTTLAASNPRLAPRNHPTRSQRTSRQAYSTAALLARPRFRTPYSSPVLSRAAFHTTALRQRDHHFDTLKFVQRLQDEGFTEEQSEAMMKVLNDVIEER